MARKECHIDRFWKYTLLVPFNECWEWIGAKAKNGYGVLAVKRVAKLAHRISYEIHCGAIEPGMMIDHKCRNRGCVNPSHLRQLTPAQNNVENSISKGALNKQKTHCKRGHIFDSANTYYRKSGARFCRKCAVLYQRQRKIDD